MVSTTYDESVELLLRLLESVGHPMKVGEQLLDFGCGRGQLVRGFRSRGVEAYGTDIAPYWEGEDDSPMLSVIEQVPTYRLPFPDQSMDVVCSTSVFEHVHDYEQSFREIHRVLKPGGRSIHIFPGPWTLPVEPHMFVPFGSVIRSRWWFQLWALLGVRNAFQRGKPWREVAELNFQYAREGIHYEPRSVVRNMVLSIFGNVRYPSKAYLAFSPGRAAKLGRALPIPFYDRMLFAFREQVVFSVKR